MGRRDHVSQPRDRRRFPAQDHFDGTGSVVTRLTTSPPKRLSRGRPIGVTGGAATKATGETLKFSVDSTPPSRERLAELLRSCELSLADQRTLGDDTPTRRAWGGFATAIVEASAPL